MKGRIYLVPVTLGDSDYLKVIPEKVIEITKQLRYFIVEDLRSARRYLRLIDRDFPIDDCTFIELNEHTRGKAEVEKFLEPVLKGSDAGILSEAGLPAIADPGSDVVAIAHRKKINVVPLTGPSSIILALISSGLNGQNFTFNGYLPVKPALLSSKLHDLEKKAKEGYAQIFMETPYRSQKMFDTLVRTCHNDTMLCIAADITLSTEFIRTMHIADWKIDPPKLEDRYVVFIIQ